jgi:gamma-glutamyltranspeptidase/glutathione hydrolase
MRVLTDTTPSVGPVTLELLNILEGWDLKALGWNTGKYLDRIARAMHVAFRDRMDLLGDPDFVDVPLDRLLSKDYASELRTRIEREEDLTRRANGFDVPPEGTTHVTVVDRDNNGAAITHSLGQSSGVVTPGLGFLHNSQMEMFDPRPGSRNEIAPWKRPLTGGGPALFVRGGRLVLLIGSPAGARKVTGIVQALLNMIDFGMDIGDAVAAERIHAELEPRTVIVEPHFPPEPLLELAALGQQVRFEWYTARLTGVVADSDGVLHGASDPRGDRGLVTV